MPLPMPYSSICSPSHMRNTVPAVMVKTETSIQDNCMPLDQVAGIAQEPWVDPVFGRRKPNDIEPALSKAEKHGGVAGVFVDLLSPGLALLLQLFQRRINAPQELENNRGRDVGHDAQAEDGRLPQVGAAEDRHLLEEVVGAAATALGTECLLQLGMVEDRQRNMRSDAKNRQEEQREEDLLPQLGNGENDADFFPHGVSCLVGSGAGHQGLGTRDRRSGIGRGETPESLPIPNPWSLIPNTFLTSRLPPSFFPSSSP